jgi:hypothetical protein
MQRPSPVPSARGAEFWFELPYAARAGGVVARHPAAAR